MKPAAKQATLFREPEPPHVAAHAAPNQAVAAQLRCAYCDAPATKLCDYRAREARVGGDGTCDTPLCDAHAKRVGSFHVDYISQGRRRARWQSIDFCQEHAQPATGAPDADPT